ncbi:MAG: rhomboid-like protein [Ilumatobacteraceae bacterium]
MSAHTASRPSAGDVVRPVRADPTSRSIRVTRWVTAQARRSPGTLIYLFVVGITMWTLSSLDSRTADALLRQVSTNLGEMSRDAPRVLVLSAFMIVDGGFLFTIVAFVLVHLPGERWLGTWRWLTIAAAGHIGASVITTVWVWFLVRTGHGGRELVFPIDVGISYALAAVAAALTFRLPRPLRVPWCVAIAAALSLQHMFTGPTFTDIGHTCAFGIGLLVISLMLPGFNRAAAAAGHPAPADSLRMPRSWSPRAWWVYISTPPPRSVRHPLTRHRSLLIRMAAVAVLLGGIFMGVLAAVEAAEPHIDSDNVAVVATVELVERSCASGCPRMDLSYTFDGRSYSATVTIPPSLSVHTGAHRQVHVKRSAPQHVVVTDSAARVDASEFFSLAALVCVGLAMLMWWWARRVRRVATVARVRGVPAEVPGKG